MILNRIVLRTGLNHPQGAVWLWAACCLPHKCFYIPAHKIHTQTYLSKYIHIYVCVCMHEVLYSWLSWCLMQFVSINWKTNCTVHFNFCLKCSSSLQMSNTFSEDTTELLGIPQVVQIPAAIRSDHAPILLLPVLALPRRAATLHRGGTKATGCHHTRVGCEQSSATFSAHCFLRSSFWSQFCNQAGGKWVISQLSCTHVSATASNPSQTEMGVSVGKVAGPASSDRMQILTVHPPLRHLKISFEQMWLSWERVLITPAKPPALQLSSLLC